MKLDLLYPAAVAAVALLYAASAYPGEPKPGGIYGSNVTVNNSGGSAPSSIKNDIHPSTSSSAVAESVGVGGSGGAGGLGGSVSAPTSVSTEVKSRALGLGSVGLTGNAPCLQSVSLAGNILSFSYTDQNCMAMQVAEQHCADDACKKQVACANPVIPDYAKQAIGCKQPQ